MTHADTAAQLVLGDRNLTYGSPEQDFACVGLAWTALLAKRGLLAPGAQIPAGMVALMMTALKLVRHANLPKDDNLVDAHGYLFCAEWIEKGEPPVPEVRRLREGCQ